MPLFSLTRPERFAQEIRRSRFLANAAPVDDEADARHFIEAQGDAQASHNCWAWRLGGFYRFSDDGEPGGTAGKPILLAIDGQRLDRVAVVVTRWFGGVLLGAGGLMRAYGGTAAACLQAAEKTAIVPVTRITLRCAFSDLALVQARLAARPDLHLDDQTFTQDGATLSVRMPTVDVDAILSHLTDLTSGRIEIVRPQVDDP